MDTTMGTTMRDLQEISNIEAADALGITMSSLKARLHRDRIFLRKQQGNYAKSPR